jgi:hyaluronan synthase
MAKTLDDVQSVGTRPTRADVFWKCGIVLVLVLLVLASLRSGVTPVRMMVQGPSDISSAAKCLWIACGGFGALYAIVALYHAIRYRPVPVPATSALPMCTVVIPAFNEGPMVRVALLSALASDYPKDRLHVIAVDDGSTDDTWLHIDRIARMHPDRVTAVRMPKNGGKREALRAGFLRARGEVVVTVDSDSKLDPGALRAAVAPIVADPEVAAVAGKVVVLNRYESVLTRLLAARFFITFDLTRAVQSRFGAVLCCPGALTAYRLDAVLAVLPSWSTQTFLGSPCTIGEDRALTTWLLRSGHRAVYQSTAIVQTLVPAAMSGVARMLVRWERGNVRESLVFLPILFTRWRTRDRLFPTIEVLFDLLQFPLGMILSLTIVSHLVSHPVELLTMIASAGVVSFVQSLYCLRSEPGTDFLYNVGYAFVALIGLQWVFPYSCFTIRNGAWLTR